MNAPRENPVIDEEGALFAARRLEDKALACISILQTVFPEDSDEEIEEKAVELMMIDTKILNQINGWLKQKKPTCGHSNRTTRYDMIKEEK